MALYSPVTYFALLFPLLLPQGVFFHHRSLLAGAYLLFFSPIYAPVGEAMYRRIARSRYRILSQVSCTLDTVINRSSKD